MAKRSYRYIKHKFGGGREGEKVPHQGRCFHLVLTHCCASAAHDVCQRPRGKKGFFSAQKATHALGKTMITVFKQRRRGKRGLVTVFSGLQLFTPILDSFHAWPRSMLYCRDSTNFKLYLVFTKNM